MISHGNIIKDIRENAGKGEKVYKRNGKTEKGLTRTSLMSMLIDEKVEKEDSEDSINVIVLHSDDTSGIAKQMIQNLNEFPNIRATADCELSVFRMMCFVSYMQAAINWSDAVVVLLSEKYLEDVKSIDSSIWRPTGSLHARHGFKLLQHKVYNNNNFPVVAAVQEGTYHNCHEFVEFKKCIHLKNDLSLSELVETISQLYHEANKAKSK